MYGTKHTYWEHEWPRKHGIVKENRPSVINMEKAQISELPSNVLKTIMVQQSVEQDDHLPRLGIQGSSHSGTKEGPLPVGDVLCGLMSHCFFSCLFLLTPTSPCLDPVCASVKTELRLVSLQLYITISKALFSTLLPLTCLSQKDIMAVVVFIEGEALYQGRGRRGSLGGCLIRSDN